MSIEDTVKAMRPWQRRAREEQIAELAKDQLERPDPQFQPYDFLEELSELSPPRNRTIHNLEATIMICVGAEIRPTRTRKLIGYLRLQRTESGELEAFEKFERFLKDVTGNAVLLGHGFAPNAFVDMDHDAIWDDVRSSIVYLSKLSSGVFLNSGTLLGVTRDKALIPHDDDVDLAFLLNANNAEDAAREWVHLRTTLDEQRLFSHDDYKDPAILKVKSKGSYEIDIFPAWIEGGRVFVYPHTFGELPQEDVFPTQKCAVTGLPIPAKPEKMLSLNYGTGWQSPDPYFKFPWAQAKRKFEVFLRAVKEVDAGA